MAKKLSRRDFIKTSSAAAAGASILSSAGPVMSALEPKGTKSRVVIAKDTTCVGNQTKVQDMVDNAIMQLTGQTDKVKAYEALFPAGKLTTSTKIIIKYNNTWSVTSNLACTALKNGLTSMIGGTFPAGNVTLVGNGNTGTASTITFSIGSNSFTIDKMWADIDYYINFAPCYTMGNSGTRMALKNLITCCSNSGAASTMHNTIKFNNTTNPPLVVLNSQPTFKDKRILVLVDAIDKASPNGSATLSGYSIIATNDIVAAEYQAMQLLKAIATTSNKIANEALANQILGLAADPKYGLGTNDPANMEVINWTPTNIVISSGDIKVPNDQIKVKSLKNRTVIQYPSELGSNGSLTVYDVHGRGIWTMQGFRSGEAWNHCDATGAAVPAGIYLYLLKAKGVIVKGMFDIRR